MFWGERSASTAPAGLGSGGSRFAGVDGVRAIAALSIVTWHVWAHGTLANRYGVSVGLFTKVFANMQAGVAVFFVVSGLLLFRPFAGALLRAEPLPSLRQYFRNRALRIIPAYWSVLLLVALFLQRGLFDRPLQLLANLGFAQSYVPSYVPTWSHGFGIAPAWSLCVEVVFYVVLPVLVIGAGRFRSAAHLSPRVAVFLPIALLLTLGLTATALSQIDHLGETFQDSFPTHAHWFAVGMILAVAHEYWERGVLRVSAGTRNVAVLVAIVLAAVAVKLTDDGVMTFLDEQTAFAVCAGLLLMLVVFPVPRSRLVAVLSSRPMTALGLMSYSIFLWHDPILRVLRDSGLTQAGAGGFVANTMLLFALTIVASAITYLYVERPALRLKAQTVRSASTPAPSLLQANGRAHGMKQRPVAPALPRASRGRMVDR